MISKERKAEIVAKHGGSTANTGKPEVQIALLTEHIKALSATLRNSTTRTTTHVVV